MTGTDVITLRCALCQSPAPRSVAEVVYFADDARPCASVRLRRGPRTCDAHVDEVAIRAAWAVLEKEVRPRLREGTTPLAWAVEFSDGRRFGGLLSPALEPRG